MNLPDIHTQKLLDCLTHSRLGFALYRLPWTDECYLVLQTSGDVEQLADIQELNGKKGFVMAPFRISEEHPLVLIRPDVTAYDWSEISEALSSLECADALLTCKSRQSELSPFVSEETDKEQYTRAFGRFITPYKRSGSRNWFCHVLPPDISEMIFTTRRFCPGLQQLSAHDDLPMPHPCFRNLAGQHTGNLIKRTRQRMAHRGPGRYHADAERSDADRLGQEEPGRAGLCG